MAPKYQFAERPHDLLRDAKVWAVTDSSREVRIFKSPSNSMYLLHLKCEGCAWTENTHYICRKASGLLSAQVAAMEMLEAAREG